MRHVEITQLLGDILAKVGVIDIDSPYNEDMLVTAAETFIHSIQPPLIQKFFKLHDEVEHMWKELSKPCMDLPEFTPEHLDKIVPLKYTQLIQIADKLGRTLEENHPEREENVTITNMWYQPTYLSIGGAYQIKVVLANPPIKREYKRCSNGGNK